MYRRGADDNPDTVADGVVVDACWCAICAGLRSNAGGTTVRVNTIAFAIVPDANPDTDPVMVSDGVRRRSNLHRHNDSVTPSRMAPAVCVYSASFVHAFAPVESVRECVFVAPAVVAELSVARTTIATSPPCMTAFGEAVTVAFDVLSLPDPRICGVVKEFTRYSDSGWVYVQDVMSMSTPIATVVVDSSMSPPPPVDVIEPSNTDAPFESRTRK